MKKLIFSFLSLLLLGSSLTWGQLKCTMGYAPGSSGADVFFTALKEGVFKECAYFEDGGYFNISGLSSGDKITIWLSTQGSDDKHPNYGASYAPADWVFAENGENPLEFTYNGESEKSLLIRKKSAGGGGDPMVSGTVTATGKNSDFCNGAGVFLENDDRQLVAQADQYGNYAFNKVPSGTYTISCKQQGWGETTLYAVEETLTVGSEDLTKNLVLSQMEGKYYALTVKALPASGFAQIIGARISCEDKSTEKVETRTIAGSYDETNFYCKPNVAYEIVVRASGYKTVKKTLTLTAAQMENIRMEEGEDETEAGNAALTGTVTVEGGGAWPSGVYIALTDASDNVLSVVSDLSGGTYSFSNVKLGSAVKFHLATDLLNPTIHSDDYTFVEAGSELNPVSFTMPADAGAEALVTKNLTVRYKGSAPATLVGRVLDESGTCLEGIDVKIKKDNAVLYTGNIVQNPQLASNNGIECDKIFKIPNVDPGTYTFTYEGNSFYEETSQTYTVAVSGPGQTIRVPDITLQGKRIECTFSGFLKYHVDGTPADNFTYVSGATITAYNSENGNTVLGTATTNESGYWTMALECALHEKVYFDASHSDITVESRVSHEVKSTQANVLISCTPRNPVEQVTLTLNANNSNWGTVSGSNTYDKGTSVTATATPNEGYEFVEWQENGATASTEAEYTFTINANRTLTAVFAEKTPVVEQVTLTLTPNNSNWGTVSGSNTYNKGTSVTAKAIPNPGYRWKEWRENDTVVKTATATYTFTIQKNRSLVAVFAPDSVTLTLEVNNSDMGSVTGGGRYKRGATAKVKATPNPNYVFVKWEEKDTTVLESTTGLAAKAEFTTKQLYNDRTLKAVFKRDSAVLTVKPNNTVRGSVTGGGKYAKGQSVTVRATANDGYEFLEWRNTSGEQVSPHNPYTFTFTETLTLTAYFTDPDAVSDSSTLTLTVNNPDMGTASARGKVGGAKFEAGETVKITATPNTGYKFVEWQENNVQLSTENPYEVDIEANHDRSIMAVFAVIPDSVNLTLLVNNEDWGVVEGEGRYQKGQSVKIIAEPSEDYVFVAWKDNDGQVRSTEKTYRFNIESDLTLTAVFAENTPVVVKDSVELKLEVNDAMGTVTGGGKYEKGSQVTAKATAKEGYKFRAWLKGEEVFSLLDEYTFPLNENLTLTAVFAEIAPVAKDSASLTLDVNDAKMGTVTGGGRYEKGTSVTAKATANEGYEFKGWQEYGATVSPEAEYTFVLNADRKLTAVFAAKPVDPVEKDSVELVLKADAAMGSVEGGGKYKKGTEVTIKATANEGYVFVAWIGNDGMMVKTAEYKLTLVSDSTLTAVFAVNTANEDREQAAWSVYVEGQTIVLRSEAACRYEIYAVSGKKIGQGRSNGKEYRITVNNSGLYIVRRITANGIATKKVMVR